MSGDIKVSNWTLFPFNLPRAIAGKIIRPKDIVLAGRQGARHTYTIPIERLHQKEKTISPNIRAWVFQLFFILFSRKMWWLFVYTYCSVAFQLWFAFATGPKVVSLPPPVVKVRKGPFPRVSVKRVFRNCQSCLPRWSWPSDLLTLFRRAWSVKSTGFRLLVPGCLGKLPKTVFVLSRVNLCLAQAC